MIYSDEEQALLDNFEFTRKELHSKSCEDGKQFWRYETLYGEAYHRLVVAGLRPKLKTRYRPH
jgi:hypothetical protein